MTEKNLPTTPEESQEASTNSFIAEKTLSQAEQLQAVQVLMKVSSYTGAKAHTVDEFLGTAVAIKGCISQPINLKKEVVDKETGEIVEQYVPEQRTIFLMENGEVISFVSKAAQSFAENFLFPIFGRGDWSFPVKIKFTQISKGQGRTFNFQIVG